MEFEVIWLFDQAKEVGWPKIVKECAVFVRCDLMRVCAYDDREQQRYDAFSNAERSVAKLCEEALDRYASSLGIFKPAHESPQRWTKPKWIIVLGGIFNE